MRGSNLNQMMMFFLFGFALGSLVAVTVVREAVPLQNHAWMIGITVIAGVPICFILYLWYKSLMRSVRTVLGEKGGGVISSILTFQVVTTAIIFILVVAVLYAAVV